MLGDLRVLDAGDELLLDTERVALQELFNMIRRFSVGFDVELHKRTLERGLLSLIGPGAEAVAGGGGLGEPEHANAARDRRRDRVRGAIRTDVGIDLLCDAADTSTAVRARCSARRRRCRRGRGRVPARRARAPSLRRRPRRHRDPPGGRAQRARRVASPRAATSARRPSRACTTAASRTAICAGCG